MIKRSTIYKENKNFKYFKVREVGFSNKLLALKNNLHADFGVFLTSTYYSIFKHSLYSSNETLQFWIIDKENNDIVGLAIAIRFHEDKKYKILSKEGAIPGVILGQLHFYLKNDYRGLGLNKIIVKDMEDFLLEKRLKNINPCIIMENQAYSLAKYTNKACVLSHSSSPEIIEKEYQNFLSLGTRFNMYKDSYNYTGAFVYSERKNG